MSSGLISKTKRITAGIMGFVMLLILLFSAFYIAAEHDHNCTGEDCPVCACILQCEKTLHQIGGGILPQTLAAVPVIFLLLQTFVLVWSFTQETLVSEKIRLDN